MQTVGQCLTECGARLAPFERRRVGRAGCIASIAAIAGAGAALALGWCTTDGWAAGLRFVVLSGLAAALALFIVFAAAETFVARGVRARLKLFLRESGESIETLMGAAAMRQDQIPGTRLVINEIEKIREMRSNEMEKEGTKGT